jgi:hypothetical protein
LQLLQIGTCVGNGVPGTREARAVLTVPIGSLSAALNASTASPPTRSLRTSGLVNMDSYRSDMPIRIRVCWQPGRQCHTLRLRV